MDERIKLVIGLDDLRKQVLFAAIFDAVEVLKETRALGDSRNALAST